MGGSGSARLELGDDMADAGGRTSREIKNASVIGKRTGLMHGTWEVSDG